MSSATSHPLPAILWSDYQSSSAETMPIFYFSELPQSIRTDAQAVGIYVFRTKGRRAPRNGIFSVTPSVGMWLLRQVLLCCVSLNYVWAGGLVS